MPTSYLSQEGAMYLASLAEADYIELKRLVNNELELIDYLNSIGWQLCHG